MLRDISQRRNEIKEDFCKAYLATFPISESDLNRVISNIELVEKWSKDRSSVSWYFRVKGTDV